MGPRKGWRGERDPEVPYGVLNLGFSTCECVWGGGVVASMSVLITNIS